VDGAAKQVLGNVMNAQFLKYAKASAKYCRPQQMAHGKWIPLLKMYTRCSAQQVHAHRN
jgi:hypothetical protein